jgi:hypothetical protein
MSIITYEFERAEHAGELKQFRASIQGLHEAYAGKEDLVFYFGGRLNINGVDIDGLILKPDAVVLIEFKNYSGKIKARANGQWTCDDKTIKGGASKQDGSTKSVFEQLSINRRALRNGLKFYLKNEEACDNLQALVVFTQLEELDLDPDFMQGRNAWVHVCDLNTFPMALGGILAQGKKKNVFISQEEMFDFVREKRLEERYIFTEYSDTHLLPNDLFNPDAPHNGDTISVVTELERVKAENEARKKANLEAVEMIQELWKKNELLKKEKESILHNIQEKPSSDAPKLPKPKRFGEPKQLPLKFFNVDDKYLDEEQYELISNQLGSMIIAGCAGSGKSVIAMHKAQMLVKGGYSVILIAYTKSLTSYMQVDFPHELNTQHHKRFYYHWEWEDAQCPTADYIIVDEIQDFTMEEVDKMAKAAQRAFFFFGDTAQSLYHFSKRTASVEEIAQHYGLDVLMLHSNYRLPKPVAQITQDYLGLNEQQGVRSYVPSIYKSEEKALPVFCPCADELAIMETIISIIHKKKLRNVGILLPNNKKVIEALRVLVEQNEPCDYKFNDKELNLRANTLNFRNSCPKIMTYHSAKGLQFETVILPFYQAPTSEDEIKAFYVAMTRTYRNLYVPYIAPLTAPLCNIPEHLYKVEEYK